MPDRRLALFGSTGSIGRQTLEVLDSLAGFKVALLAARSNWELLVEQALAWRPELVTVADEAMYPNVRDALAGSGMQIAAGADAAAEAAAGQGFDIALNAFVGFSGLRLSFEVLQRGIDLALANKESLVLAGGLLNDVRHRTGSKLLPVDSEHSAIFQCLWGERSEDARRLILTASGGPFRTWPGEKIASATAAEALSHPTWKMGAKVTVDSATLMNKGLEVIEAFHLFGIPPERIEVRIHPVSIVHSLVQFSDGSFKAQLGSPDMRLPIQVALTHPGRRPSSFLAGDDPTVWPALEFLAVERERYPCLGLAYRSLAMGGTAPAVLNGADEVAVECFLAGEISFGDIPRIIENALDRHHPVAADSLEVVIAANAEGRRSAMDFKLTS